MIDAQELVRKHHLSDQDVVGFSVYNESLAPAVEMARTIKAENPSSTVVFGGPHSTAIHETIATRHADVDYVVRGEGELTLLHLLNIVSSGKRPLLIPGVTTARNGHVTIGPGAAPIEELDSLPFPDLEFVSEDPYPPSTYWNEGRAELVPALTLNTSRSCPYNCSFCGVLTIGREYRMRSPESIASEFIYFRDRDQTRYLHVYFSDANFFVKPQRAIEVFEALRAVDSEVTFSFGTRVNQIIRASPLLGKMRELGLRFIELGIESNSKPMLKRLAKGVTPEMNTAAVRMLSRHEIDLSLDFIMFDPSTETSDLLANLQFLREVGLYDYVPHDHLYTRLVLYAGTPIRDYYANLFGLRFDDESLPRTEDLYTDEDVARIDRQLTWFRFNRQPVIDQLLSRLELACEVLRRPYPHGWRVLAEAQLDAVALRNLPTTFFEQLVAGVPEGGGDDRLASLVDHLLEGRGGWNATVERASDTANQAEVPSLILADRHINGRVL